MMRIHAKVIYRGNVNIEGLVPHIIQTFVHMGEGSFTDCRPIGRFAYQRGRPVFDVSEKFA